MQKNELVRLEHDRVTANIKGNSDNALTQSASFT